MFLKSVISGLNIKIDKTMTNDLTRPDTRPMPVADGWAGAEMRVFALSQLDHHDQQTDGWTDKACYRIASPRLKTAPTEDKQATKNE